MTPIDKIFVQFLSLCISVIFLIAITFYWKKGAIGIFFAIPPSVIYVLSFLFYVYVLTDRGEPSIIVTTISSYLRFFELSVGLGMLVAIGERRRKNGKKK